MIIKPKTLHAPAATVSTMCIISQNVIDAIKEKLKKTAVNN